MARSCARPPVPPLAERARAVAVRARSAALVTGIGGDTGDGGDGAVPDDLLRVVPTLHHVTAGGAATLQLPVDHPVVALTRERGTDQLPVMLELTDTAPVTLRQPVRGLLWISGRLRVLPPRVARRAALRIASELPDERLLDVGHGDTMLRVDPASLVLSDAEGSGALAPTEMAAAPADPLHGIADGWLRHLATAHPGVVAGLVRHLPGSMRRSATTIAPLAVDRLGIRLRIECPRDDHDVRLAFSRPVGCPRALGEEIRRLAGVCGAGGSGGGGVSGTPGTPARPSRPEPSADA